MSTFSVRDERRIINGENGSGSRCLVWRVLRRYTAAALRKMPHSALARAICAEIRFGDFVSPAIET
jgi:hypothetical protein